MTNKLCCVLNPEVACDVCGLCYCDTCVREMYTANCAYPGATYIDGPYYHDMKFPGHTSKITFTL